MIKGQKRICLLLAGTILLTTLVTSCAQSESKAEVSAATGAVTTGAETDARSGAVDLLPDGLDFGGAGFTILVRSEEPYYNEFYCDQTGEIVDDAVYNRNMSVEQRLNVKINVDSTIGNWPNSDNYIAKVRSIVSSGDTTYNAFAEYAEPINGVGSEGLFMNWNKIEYVDMTQPWWNESIIREFTIGGKLYFLAGDLTMTLLSHSIVIFFNKEIAKNYNVEDLYQTVSDGEWTLDRFISVAKSVAGDTDGNGVYDENDLYGLGLPLNSQVDAFYASLNIPVTGQSEDGSLKLVFDVDKMSGVLKKLSDLIYGTNSVYAPSSFDDATSNDIRVMFTKGHFLMHPNTLYSATTDVMRDMSDDYGIIPYPKYDETQKDYSTYAWNQYSLLCVPKTCPDASLTGAVTEALAAETYRSVTTVYFEEALKQKYSRDDASSRMLDIIASNIDINFGFLTTGIIFILRTQIRDKSTDIASAYAKDEKSYETQLDKLMKDYTELPD